jgi:hypothetical protein
MRNASRAILCAGALFLTAGAESQAQDAVLSADTEQAAPRVRLLRAYDEFVKVDGVEHRNRVELFFDYTQGVAREVVYDSAGARVSDRAVPGQPRPTEEEIAEAIAIVRADRVIGGMIARVKAVPDGGFILTEAEGKACGPRSRCLHVFWLSPDRAGLVRWTVVDLVKQAIAYRAYHAPDEIAPSEEVSK